MGYQAFYPWFKSTVIGDSTEDLVVYTTVASPYALYNSAPACLICLIRAN